MPQESQDPLENLESQERQVLHKGLVVQVVLVVQVDLVDPADLEDQSQHQQHLVLLEFLKFLEKLLLDLLVPRLKVIMIFHHSLLKSIYKVLETYAFRWINV